MRLEEFIMSWQFAKETKTNRLKIGRNIDLVFVSSCILVCVLLVVLLILFFQVREDR